MKCSLIWSFKTGKSKHALRVKNPREKLTDNNYEFKIQFKRLFVVEFDFYTYTSYTWSCKQITVGAFMLSKNKNLKLKKNQDTQMTILSSPRPRRGRNAANFVCMFSLAIKNIYKIMNKLSILNLFVFFSSLRF